MGLRWRLLNGPSGRAEVGDIARNLDDEAKAGRDDGTRLEVGSS